MRINLEKKTLGCLFLCLFLIQGTAACTHSLSPANEKLRLSCLNEAEVVNGKVHSVRAPTRGHPAPKIPAEVYEAKSLCRQMTAELQHAQEKNGQASSERKAVLDKKCEKMLKQYASKYPTDIEHVSAMKNICQKMLIK